MVNIDMLLSNNYYASIVIVILTRILICLRVCILYLKECKQFVLFNQNIFEISDWLSCFGKPTRKINYDVHSQEL